MKLVRWVTRSVLALIALAGVAWLLHSNIYNSQHERTSKANTQDIRMDRTVDTKAMHSQPVEDIPYLEIHNYGADETVGNNRLNTLAGQKKTWLAKYLIKAINDEAHTVRWRNYCVQHLATHNVSHNDEAVFSELLRLTNASELEVADVAVYSIARICRETNVTQDDPRYGEARVVIQENLKGTRHPNMICSAIRSAVLLSDHSFNAQILKFAKNNSNDISVRVAAVDAIGALALSQHEDLLRSFLQIKSPAIRNAAAQALRRLYPLDAMIPKKDQSPQTLKHALLSPHAQTRNEAISALSRFGLASLEASNEFHSAFKQLSASTNESEIVPYLDLIRTWGNAGAFLGDDLNQLLDARSSIYSDKEKVEVNRLRAYILVTLADTGKADIAAKCILDSLANSDAGNQLNYAAAAYAVSRMNGDRLVFVSYLLKALESDFVDNAVALNGYRIAVTELNRTSARLEAIRALGMSGSGATIAISFLKKWEAPDQKSGALQYHTEARIALSRIQGEPK